MFNACVYRLPRAHTHMHTPVLLCFHSDATGIVSHHQQMKKNLRKGHIHTQHTDINKDFSFCNIFFPLSLSQKEWGKANRTLERRQTRFTFHHCVFTLSITVYLRRACSAGEVINWLEYRIYRCASLRVCVCTMSKPLKDKTTCMCSIFEYICFLLFSSVLLGSWDFWIVIVCVRVCS